MSSTIPTPPASHETPAPPTAPPAYTTAPPPPPTAPPAYAAAPPSAAPAYTNAPVANMDVPRYPDGKPMLDPQGRTASPKSRLAAAVMAWFLGFLGIHRFYAGKVGTGILMIVTLGGLGIWVLIDFIVILLGSFKDKQGRVLSNW